MRFSDLACILPMVVLLGCHQLFGCADAGGNNFRIPELFPRSSSGVTSPKKLVINGVSEAHHLMAQRRKAYIDAIKERFPANLIESQAARASNRLGGGHIGNQNVPNVIPQQVPFHNTKKLNYTSLNLGRASVPGPVVQMLLESVGECIGKLGDGLWAEISEHQGENNLVSCNFDVVHPPDSQSQIKDSWRKKDGERHRYNLCAMLKYWLNQRSIVPVVTRRLIDTWGMLSFSEVTDFSHRYVHSMVRSDCQRRRCLAALRYFGPRTTNDLRPGSYGRCAVVGNHGDLREGFFGKEIDQADAVFRLNDAPTKGFEKQVGRKTTFRVLNHKAWSLGLRKVVEAPHEKIIVRNILGSIKQLASMAAEIKNPVYLALVSGETNSAKGSGVFAVRIALSLCKSVHIYGFSVDSGYSRWTRYFSSATSGHYPLTGRSYYQVQECIGAINIHSPKRDGASQVGGVNYTDADRLSVLAATRSAVQQALGYMVGDERCAVKAPAVKGELCKSGEGQTKCECIPSRPSPFDGDQREDQRDAKCQWEPYSLGNHWSRGTFCIARPHQSSSSPPLKARDYQLGNDDKMPSAKAQAVNGDGLLQEHLELLPIVEHGDAVVEEGNARTSQL